MSHSQQESARGTAKEPTIEYSDSTRTTAAGSEAYGDPKVYGSNPNPHNDVSKFGRDTHVNQDSLVKDRADGKDRLGNDSNLTGSTQQGDLSGTTVKPTHGGDFAQHSHSHDASHVHDNNCSHSHDNTSSTTSHLHNNNNNNNNNDSSLENASSTGGLGAIKASKVPGAGTFDTEKNTHKQVFDGPVHGHGGPGGAGSSVPGSGSTFDQNQNHSGAFGGADVGGSGVGTGIKSDYDALGNRVGPGHQEGHTFLDENHGEKVGIVDKIKGKLGMNTGDERHGDFSKVDQHGANHAGGQGGADRL